MHHRLLLLKPSCGNVRDNVTDYHTLKEGSNLEQLLIKESCSLGHLPVTKISDLQHLPKESSNQDQFPVKGGRGEEGVVFCRIYQ